MSDQENRKNTRPSADQDDTEMHRLSDTPVDTDTVNQPGSNGSAKASESDQKSETDKLKNDFLYLRAEFDNYKKNMLKERSDLRKYGSERLVVDILGVLDILETALASEVTSENLGNFRKGIELTANELRSTLNRHGVEEVPAQNRPFDPSTHEALSSEETEAVPPGHVSQVFKKPYRLHERVIRPGQVVVAKAKPTS